MESETLSPTTGTGPRAHGEFTRSSRKFCFVCGVIAVAPPSSGSRMNIDEPKIAVAGHHHVSTLSSNIPYQILYAPRVTHLISHTSQNFPAVPVRNAGEPLTRHGQLSSSFFGIRVGHGRHADDQSSREILEKVTKVLAPR